MDILVYIGSAMAVLGLGGLGYCIKLAADIKREGSEAADFKARMQRLGAINMASLGVAALGLMTVIIGMVL